MLDDFHHFFNTSSPRKKPMAVTANPRTAFEHEPLEVIWEAVKPYAVRLLDIIMQNPPPPLPPPNGSSASAPLPIPSILTRRVACTHLTMERVYGAHKCMVCYRVPDFGWVYMCTQDEEEPLSDCRPSNPSYVEATRPGSCTTSSDEPGHEPPNVLTQLSPWIEKAIEQGHYTPEQIKMLRAQKQKVHDTIAAAEEYYIAIQKSSMDSNQSQDMSTLPSVDANIHLPYPIITEVKEVPVPIPDDAYPQPKLKVFPHCRFRSCQLCRPTYRDRTWQTLENIFEQPSPSISAIFEDGNRRLANPNVVLNLGIHKVHPTRPTRPPLRPLNTLARSSTEALGKHFHNHSNPSTPTTIGSPSRTITSDITSSSPTPESHGFRDSVKRAFRGMISSRHRRSVSSRNGIMSTSRKERILHEEDGKEDDAADFDMGLWRQLNEELLMEASMVKLPGHDGMDGLGGERGEVEVGGGVAVTEEGLDLGMADIIMSV